MRVLLIGDIVGRDGRRAVKALVPELRREYGCCFCIANAENSAGGAGLRAGCVTDIAEAVDVVTAGDHVWDQRDFLHEIRSLSNVVRPANVCPEQPGRGYQLVNIPIGGQICVITVLGRIFMNNMAQCPFAAVDRILKEVAGRTRTIFVDIHAEATSEKIAMGRYLDGRVTAVFGTHTHVQTADEQIFPGGTAHITDIGMVGAEESVLGREVAPVVHRFRTGMPARFKVAGGPMVLNGAVVTFDGETGRATAIERVRRVWRNQEGAP